MNSFGQRFRFTTFGESHGVALGCIVDGIPAGIKIDLDFIQNEMNKRKPGKQHFFSCNISSKSSKLAATPVWLSKTPSFQILTMLLSL